MGREEGGEKERGEEQRGERHKEDVYRFRDTVGRGSGNVFI